jgi:hypothetical protein
MIILIDNPVEDKVNFVDEISNIVLGYDVSCCCCEEADWYISDDIIPERPREIMESLKPGERDLLGWQFDKDFCQELSPDNCWGGGLVVFRIVRDGQQKFIHIFNAHNGYYAHGFTFTKDEGKQIIRQGRI